MFIFSFSMLQTDKNEEERKCQNVKTFASNFIENNSILMNPMDDSLQFETSLIYKWVHIRCFRSVILHGMPTIWIYTNRMVQLNYVDSIND